MLTADLVFARVRRGCVEPAYCDPSNEELLGRAAFIIESFKGSKGQKRGEIFELLDTVFEASTEIKFDRGLAKLCFDRSDFEVAAAAAPVELRERIFEAAFEARANGGFSRDAVLDGVAAELGITASEAEAALYADLRDNERLIEFRSLTPRALLERYNLALAQAVLLKATKLEIEIKERSPPRYRRLFRALKFHRLLHRADGSMKRGYRITIDGPMSLFTLSQQYGMRMANFLPNLLLAKRWSLEAQVQWGLKKTMRRFKLDHEMGLKSHVRDVGVWLPEEVDRLAEQWPEDNAWTLSTDTDVLELGGHGVFIPDFVFEHREHRQRVYMELLGYWNKSALLGRLQLLREHGPDNLILAISKGLCIDKDGLARVDISALPGEVYVYRSFPIKRELLKRLERWERS